MPEGVYPHVEDVVPVPDRVEVDSDLGDTTITLSYTNPVSQRFALAFALKLVEAHRDRKTTSRYRGRND